jgi:hypothetical protein
MLKAWTPQSIREALGTQQENQGGMEQSSPQIVLGKVQLSAALTQV